MGAPLLGLPISIYYIFWYSVVSCWFYFLLWMLFCGTAPVREDHRDKLCNYISRRFPLDFDSDEHTRAMFRKGKFFFCESKLYDKNHDDLDTKWQEEVICCSDKQTLSGNLSTQISQIFLLSFFVGKSTTCIVCKGQLALADKFCNNW